MERTIIIAEAGECFNGDMKTAVRLIRAAKDAGCDIVKFQTLDKDNIAEDDPEREWFLKISLDPKRIKYLVESGSLSGIEVMFTPENVKTARWLLDAGLNSVKIASSTIGDGALLDFVNTNFKKVFISTGMASLKGVRTAVGRLKRVRSLYIMHCVSEYPTGPLLEKRGLEALKHNDVRLNMMKTLIRTFPGRKIGYSDHTSGILAPVVAVAAGASVIEKHITLDRKTPVDCFKSGKKYLGTDHILSLEPEELAEMVRQIREAESMFGSRRWERSDGEKILKNFLRGRFRNEKA